MPKLCLWGGGSPRGEEVALGNAKFQHNRLDFIDTTLVRTDLEVDIFLPYAEFEIEIN